MTVLAELVAGRSLDSESSREALTTILRGEVSEAVIASFLTALTAKGATLDEMCGFIDAMLDLSVPLSAPEGTLDVVGTGGDRLHTVNISTLAALTVAGAGVPVAKHGNRAASSTVGTADVLESLGVRIECGPALVEKCVNEAGFGFCFAPAFHPGLRYLGPIRRAIGFPTVFNYLGPLANPAGVRRLLVGVADASMLDSMAHVLARRGVDAAILVHSHDGLDELSLGATSTLRDVRGAAVTARDFDARTAIGASHSVDELRGGDVTVNRAAALALLDGEPGAVRDVVVANAALALTISADEADYASAIGRARESIDSGRARTVLRQVVDISNR